MRNFTPQVEGNIRTRTDFLISSILVQTCWILLLYLFMYSSAYAHTSLNLSDGRFFQTTMCDNAIEGGEISGDERGCDDPVFDPTMIQNVTLPTGGTGTLEYLWIFTTDDPEAEFSVWTPIMNTNAPTYNPPAITETTYYRRCARRSGCDDYVVESNYVTKEVACCDNVTDGGSIRADQTSCSDTYDPQPLLNVNLPMGGSGDIEYLWFASNVGPPFFPESPNWTEIIGSNNMSYDPGIITETTYYIRCSRRLGCVTFTGESNIVEITLSNPLTINVMSTPPSCSMQNNGSIRLQVIGGAMPFDYFWTNGIGNTGNPTNLSAGTYAVTVTDNNGCENSTQITLNEPNPLQLDLSSTDAGCGNENNGSVSVAVNGGTAPYIYKWDDANNSTTASVNNLAAGTYRVMITDNNGCSDMGSVTVDGNDAFDLTLNMNNADCFGQNTGSATVTAMGGDAPFSYQWNDPAEQTTQTATNLAAGSYFVSVFDANNCLTIGNVMIDEPTELNVNLTSTDASCDDGNNGTATANVTGGTPPYEYQWDDFARQTTAMATGLAPAVYRLQVTDANGCINKSQVTVGGSASFEAKVTITDASCENPNSGAAVAVVDTGSGSYAYRWNNNETSQVINNLTAGTYTVTITDNSTGCSAVASGTVETTGNLVLSTSKNDATCGENNGTATVNITGGTAPFIYQWNDANNQTTQTATNLAAGTYMVTVSDANGCSATTNVQVLGGGNLNVSTSKNDATCGASNGTATATATGGTAPFTYQWNDINNQTTRTATNLAAGTYTVTVRDANGCSATADVQILGGGNLAVSTSKSDANCSASNGMATATVTGGTAPFTYQWNDANNQTTQTATNLAAGTYTVTVRDANGCSATANVQILGGSNLNVSINKNDATCGASNGTATATATGGTAPFTYQWNDANNQTTQTATNLAAGTYTVTVRDANGCSATANVQILGGGNLTVSINKNDAACGANDGTATAMVAGGTAPFTYQWTDSNNQTTQTATNLAAGTYTVTVRDANGCSATANVQILGDNNLSITIAKTNASCEGGSNGTATANPANGTAPYFYRWSNNQNTQTINNLASGSYSVTVTDNNGCSAIASTLITEGGSLQLELSVTDVTCNGLTNGEIRSSVTGGQAPFTYQWSNNSTTQNLTNLPAGVYALTITDVNGCQDIQQTRVEQPANLIATTSTIASTCNSTNGEIAVSVGGGTAPYTYRWNDANNSTSQVINNIAAGTYTVTVTDANGCTTSSVGTVTNTASPTVTISKNDALCNGNNGAASANVNSGTAPYTYRWSNNETTQTINNLSSGNYTVTVTDNNGCTATATTNIQASTSPLVSINPVNATCDSNNGSAAANVTSGAAPYTYRWSNNQTTAIINNLNDGTYTVTVTDNNGCTATATTTIQTTSNPTVIVSTTDEICGNQNGTATAEASGGTAPYTSRWTNNQTTRTATNLASGSYTVTVTDANGCTAIASTTISGSNPVVAAISPTSAAVCSGESVQLNATPDATNATYEWTATGGSFDNSTVANPIYTMMMPGTYTITVTVRRADGCSDTVTTTVTINANPVVAIQPPAPDLCGGGSIDFVADVSGGTTGLTYAWSANVGTFNDNTLAEPTYTINQVGTYEVSLTVTNSAGCTATTQSSVTVTDAPTCEAVITSDYDGLDVSTYNGSDGAATVNVAGGSGDYTYRWSNGQTTESVSNLGAGSYRVTVTDGNSCQCISSVRLRDAAKLGNFVWNDVDKDGIQDGNEPGIPNVTVTLTGTNINGGTVNRTTTTDATGMYMFDGLVPGDYKVTFTQPTGFRPTVQDQGGDDAMDSDINPNTGMTQVVTLDYGDYDETLDAGYFSSGVNIGDFVFIDSNRNGIQDNGEEGLSDVILVLVDKGPDNIYGTSDDNTIGQTMTNFFGDYLFENVPVGSYIIHIVRNSLPRNYQLTTRNAGTDDEIDSDFNTNTLVSDMFMVNETQSDDLSHDVGVFPICDNVTDAGEIAADEAVCGAGSIPSLITSVRDASGGGGELQDYLWLRSTLSVFNGIEDPNWVVIDGATEATYQPEQIYETTYYIRCARREDCPDYRETNIVQKRIVPYPTSDLESGSTSVCTNESSTYVAEIGGFGNVTYDWHFGDNAVPQTASGRAATASWTTAGTKTISLNVIQNGCASYTTYTITVVECPGLLGNFTTVEAELTTEYAVDLMWMTEGEPVNTNYVIQRANADASKFETIDLMPAKGGTTTQTYHCVDVKPNIGKNYYRVKHFDVNGRFTYSNVVEIMVQPQGTKDVIFYPNPFRDQTTLQVVGEVETDVNVQIVSAYGQVVDVQTVPLGTNFYNLDLSTYPKGVYYVYVTYNGYRKASYRLLKTDDN